MPEARASAPQGVSLVCASSFPTRAGTQPLSAVRSPEIWDWIAAAGDGFLRGGDRRTRDWSPCMREWDNAGPRRPSPDEFTPQEIFKAYDIRGVVGKSLTTEGVRLIGQALGSGAFSERSAEGTAGDRSGP